MTGSTFHYGSLNSNRPLNLEFLKPRTQRQH
jgi:hypothetical protein